MTAIVPSYDRLAYFGDSLTDSDEFFAASSAVAFFGIPLAALGYAGQFSNGDVYADLVPNLIGVTGGEGLNYAVGGAQALTDRTIGDILPGAIIRPDATSGDLAFRIDIDGQVDRFLADEAGQDLSMTAASIFIGFNDLDDFVATSPATALGESVLYGVSMAEEALAAAGVLAAAGTGTIILNTLGDPSIFPATQNDPLPLQGLATAATQAFNQALAVGVDGLEASGTDVIIVDMAAIFAEIEADFSSFGFRTLDDAVLLPDFDGDGVEEINPVVAGVPLDQIAFFDVVHPTAALHGILAAFQAKSLTSNVHIGNNGADALLFTHDDDLLLAREGNDRLLLRGGDDVGLGGLGDDLIVGGYGDDLTVGGAGADRVVGGWGDDILVGGDDNDWVAGGRGNDLHIDGQGDDAHRGGLGDDTFVFTEGALMGRAEDARNLMMGNAGDDTLILRVADAGAVSSTQFGRWTVYEDLGLWTRDIETIVIVEGTDLTGEAFYDDRFATADLWNFV